MCHTALLVTRNNKPRLAAFRPKFKILFRHKHTSREEKIQHTTPQHHVTHTAHTVHTQKKNRNRNKQIKRKKRATRNIRFFFKKIILCVCRLFCSLIHYLFVSFVFHWSHWNIHKRMCACGVSVCLFMCVRALN